MHAETARRALMPREPRPTSESRPWRALRSALLLLAKGHGAILRHSEQPWASITFAGARHTMTLAFAGLEAIAAGEELIAALPDHEFAIPGQLVAEARIVSVSHTQLPDPVLTAEVELLLLEES